MFKLLFYLLIFFIGVIVGIFIVNYGFMGDCVQDCVKVELDKPNNSSIFSYFIERYDAEKICAEDCDGK